MSQVCSLWACYQVGPDLSKMDQGTRNVLENCQDIVRYKHVISSKAGPWCVFLVPTWPGNLTGTGMTHCLVLTPPLQTWCWMAFSTYGLSFGEGQCGCWWPLKIRWWWWGLPLCWMQLPGPTMWNLRSHPSQALLLALGMCCPPSCLYLAALRPPQPQNTLPFSQAQGLAFLLLGSSFCLIPAPLRGRTVD